MQYMMRNYGIVLDAVANSREWDISHSTSLKGSLKEVHAEDGRQ